MNGTDMILYVSAVNTQSCTSSGAGSSSTIAFAESCQLESGMDRYTNVNIE